MASIWAERRNVNLKALFEEGMAKAQTVAVERLTAGVEQGLRKSSDELLGREAYVRRKEVAPWIEVSGSCHECKSRQSWRFSRNGGRERSVLALWGEVTIWMQRLKCECGGSVLLELDNWLQSSAHHQPPGALQPLPSPPDARCLGLPFGCQPPGHACSRSRCFQYRQAPAANFNQTRNTTECIR